MARSPIIAAVVLITITSAQTPTLRTTVPLVVVPASVADKQGRPIYGLSGSDFVVLDDGKPATIRVETSDEVTAPVSFIALVQTSDLTSAVLAKLRKVGAMLSQAVVGANGEAAVLTFDENVTLVQEFTSQPDLIQIAFEALKLSDSGQARMIDAVDRALDMLANRPGPRRAAILIIGESRARMSQKKLDAILEKAQRSGCIIYGLTYSAFLTPFTARPDDYTPPENGAPDYVAGIRELVRLKKPKTVDLLAAATGGRRLGFERQTGLENDLIALGKDLHSRYLITFTPEPDEQGQFHYLEVRVKGRSDVIVRARPGYWSAPAN